MESLQKDNLTKYIGVSNINADQLLLLIDKTSIKPKFVQNRCFAQLGWDKSIRKICDENDIIYQGFSLLTANRNYISDPKIKQIVEKYGETIPGIIFSFAKQIGMLPLTGTTDQVHMKQDLLGIDTRLTEDEMHLIETIAII